VLRDWSVQAMDIVSLTLALAEKRRVAKYTQEIVKRLHCNV
jgi:hypothetical protein